MKDFSSKMLVMAGCFLALFGETFAAPSIYQLATIPGGTGWTFPYQLTFNSAQTKLIVADASVRTYYSVQSDGTKTVFAGAGSSFINNDDVAATSVFFSSIGGVWDNQGGTVYVSDPNAAKIYKIVNGKVFHKAGAVNNGGFTAVSGPATSTPINGIWNICGDTDGNIFFTEQYSVRKVDVNGIASVFAGVNVRSYYGAGGPATSAAFEYPNGMAAGSNGDVFFSSDHEYPGRIHRVAKADNIFTVIAGGGGQRPTVSGVPAISSSIRPLDMHIDAQDNIYVVEMNNVGYVSLLAKENDYQTIYLIYSVPAYLYGITGDSATGKLYVSGQSTKEIYSLTPSVSNSPTQSPTTISPTSAKPSVAPSALPSKVPSVSPSAAPSVTPSATPSSAPTQAPTMAVPEYSVTVSAKSFKYFEVRAFTADNERVMPVSYNLVDCPENAGAVIWGQASTPTTEDTNTCVYGLPRHYWCECPALGNGNKPKLTLNFGETVFDRLELLILDWEDGEVTVSDSANNIVLFSATRPGGPIVEEEFVGYNHLNLLQIAPSVVPTVAPSSVPSILPSRVPTTKPTPATVKPTQTPTVAPTTTAPSAVPSVEPSIAPSAAPSFTAQYTITLTAKTFKYFEVRVYTHDNLRIFPVSYELEHCPENAGITVWNEQTTEDTNTCVYGYPRNFWCQCSEVTGERPKLVLHMGHTVFDRVELLLLNWQDGLVTVTDEANHETFLSATHDGVGNEFVTYGNLDLQHLAPAPARRLLRGA